MAGDILLTNGDVQIGTGSTLTQTVLCSAASAGKDPAAGATYANVWVANTFNPNTGFEMINLDINRVGQPGVYTGSDTPTTRRIEFDLWINAASATQLSNTVSALTTAMAPRSTGEAELAFQVNGTKYVMYGRYRGFDNTSPERYGLVNNRRIQRWRIRFLATDPFIYMVTPTTFNLPAVTGNSGGYTRGAPPNYNTTTFNTQTLSVSHTVVGQAQPRWQLSIPANHRNPLVNNYAAAGAQVIVFTGGLYWVDASGTQATAFTARSWDRTTTNGMGKFIGPGSTWPVLTPGTTRYWFYSYNNEIALDGLAAGSTGTATMTYWPAYYMVSI